MHTDSKNNISASDIGWSILERLGKPLSIVNYSLIPGFHCISFHHAQFLSVLSSNLCNPRILTSLVTALISESENRAHGAGS
jgi:hypothetical protein